jgi:ATP-dependent DNA ligase
MSHAENVRVLPAQGGKSRACRSRPWILEIRYDGYRLRIERQGKTVRLITENGHNWTDRFPWIVEAARKNRERQFVIDGEAVALGSTASPISTRCIRARGHRLRSVRRRSPHGPRRHGLQAA